MPTNILVHILPHCMQIHTYHSVTFVIFSVFNMCFFTVSSFLNAKVSEAYTANIEGYKAS